jgi:hypothetical protein
MGEQEHTAEGGAPRGFRGGGGNGKGHGGNGKGQASRKRRSSYNALALVEHVERRANWVGEIRFNQLAERIEVRNPPWPIAPAWYGNGDALVSADGWRPLTDADLREAMLHLQANGVGWVKVGNVLELLAILGDRALHHPVRVYLRRLIWDGTARVHRLFTHYIPAQLPTDPKRRARLVEYLEAIGPRFLVGAVARAEQPGCKVDNMISLVGPQGRHKSTSIEALCPTTDLFAEETSCDLDNRDVKLSLSSKWFIEFSEGAVLGAEIRRLKGFLTRKVDTLRLPYGRLIINKPRQSIFVLTTNLLRLKDTTGNRRYWPIQIADNAINIDAIIADRDELWGEAATLFADGYQWWLTPELEALAAEQQARYADAPDPTTDLVRDWVAGKDGFPLTDVLQKALGLSKPEILRGGGKINREVTDALHELGYESYLNNERGRDRGKRLWGLAERPV